MLTLSRWNALWRWSKIHPTSTKMASPDWPGNTDLKARNSLVHSLLIFLLQTQPVNESTAREETTIVWLKEMQQVKRCMHYHDNWASIRIGLIQLKVNWFYSINYIKLYYMHSYKHYQLLLVLQILVFVHQKLRFMSLKLVSVSIYFTKIYERKVLEVILHTVNRIQNSWF